MARATFGVGGAIATTLCFDEPTNAVWFATADGAIRTFRVLGQRTSVLGTGWTHVLAVLPSIDGLTFRVVLRSGEVCVATRDRANRAEATVVSSIGSSVVGADRLDDDDLLLLDAAGTLQRVTPSSGAVVEFAGVVPGAALLTVDRRNGELVLAAKADDWTLQRFTLSDGTTSGAAIPLTASLAGIAPRGDGDGVLLVNAAGGVTSARWSGAAEPFSFTSAGVSALCAWHSLVIAASGSELQLVEWGDDVELLPLACGFDPVAVGGWVPMTVDYSALALGPDDVEWRVREGSDAGGISVARPSAQPLDRYEHRILSGIGAPEFTLEATEIASGATIATRRFRIVTCWPDTRLGPPMAVTGAHQVYAKPGWGGGPNGPQNINTHPAPSEFRVAFAVFRTKGASSSINGPGRVSYLRGKMTDAGQSVKAFYEEVSFRNTPASANPNDPQGTTVTLLGGQVFGPIDLDYSFGDLFEPANKDDPWSSWNPKGGTWDILGGSFSAAIVDLGLADAVTRLADSVVLAVLPGTDGPYMVGTDSWPAQWSWAMASDAQFYWKTPFSTTFTRIPAVLMPAGFPSGHPAPWKDKEWVSTICHELGHTLGCPDLYSGSAYPAEIDGRYIDGWDLMASDAPLPHFSLAHRMRLGWINPDWIEVCDFGKNPASRTVTLESMETMKRTGPSPGRKAGVEVRIRDGWNYYFEFRRAVATQIGDRELPASGSVLGTDLVQAAADEMARPLIMLLPKDVDDDGPVLKSGGQDYEESDVTNPDRMNDFVLTRKFDFVFPVNKTSTTVDIQYVGAHRAELQITPAPGRDNFKSPDIDLDGPAGPNVVVKGRQNTIVARVNNRGSKAANAVQIRVKWLPFTTAPGAWTDLALPPMQAIPAHSTRTFTIPWTPPASVTIEGTEVEHFCIRVDVDRYVDPTDPSGSEIVIFNNWAQSNFMTSAVGHGSPSERRDTVVRTTNKLPEGAIHHMLIEQSSEYFRAFLDHSWKRLAPGETASTTLAFESLAGDPAHGRAFEREFRETHGEQMVNDLRARTFILPDRKRDGAIERWGVQLMVRAGLRTFIDPLEARGELVRGQIHAGDPPGTPVEGGQVRVIAWPRSRPDRQLTVETQVQPDGTFRVGLPGEVVQIARGERVLVEAYYLGTTRYTRCRSKTIALRVE
jgi:hypothetical protein